MDQLLSDLTRDLPGWLAHSSAQPLDAFPYRDSAHLRDDVLPQHYSVLDGSNTTWSRSRPVEAWERPIAAKLSTP
ncbi:hypothetical protein [Microbacterium halotolerans]|uniref:hypothetical protein n=1 Tax=Microbacterium halotolerans TaxID=246613 RepID=UPI0013C2E763|nr:hypothetical protein [Microbacterium halotolerans]